MLMFVRMMAARCEYFTRLCTRPLSVYILFVVAGNGDMKINGGRVNGEWKRGCRCLRTSSHQNSCFICLTV